ncbi:MAG: hypothetical protein LBB18_01390 [Puniceicoccales bacterium]|jgi:hypothetical protein|nr:hypothetical protein [Puniceicoccales bacterium]
MEDDDTSFGFGATRFGGGVRGEGQALEDPEEFSWPLDDYDPMEAMRYTKEYSVRAFAPMLAWVRERAENGDREQIIQYDEVMDELEKFSPKYNSEISLCVLDLLPELQRTGELPKLPESLVVVLYTLHLIHREGTRLLEVKKLDSVLEFTAEFDSYIDGKTVTSACKYRLQNYLSPKDMELEVVEHWPVRR